MRIPHWEVGSEFDWSESHLASEPGPSWLPDRHTLFATGTACIQAIPSSGDIQARRSTRLPSRPKIHLPSFYCMTVVNALAGQFEICWYHDVPNEPGPDLQSIKVENGDYILILNSFGVRTQDAWAPWIAQHPSVVTVEDHSHDPFSAWAQSSTADFAFASLRKTLPIPDGGLLYSPKGLSLPRPQSGESIGAAKRLTAMLLKNAFLRGHPIDKDAFRRLEIASHAELEADGDAAASKFSCNVLPLLDIHAMRQRKRLNIQHFLELAAKTPPVHWTPLLSTLPPEGNVPLNAIVVCSDREVRDSLRRHLISSNVYTAIHWSLDEQTPHDPLAVQLADRILTIPVDFRYENGDVERVFDLMRTFDYVAKSA